MFDCLLHIFVIPTLLLRLIVATGILGQVPNLGAHNSTGTVFVMSRMEVERHNEWAIGAA